MDTHIPIDRIVEQLRQSVPKLMAIYAFGSQVAGTANAESDLDLAVLVEGYADPILLFDLSSDLAEIAGCEVDLLDLRAASTVMQHQVVAYGERLWESDVRAKLYECFIFSEKWDLDERNKGILEDIEKRGKVYG